MPVDTVLNAVARKTCLVSGKLGAGPNGIPISEDELQLTQVNAPFVAGYKLGEGCNPTRDMSIHLPAVLLLLVVSNQSALYEYPLEVLFIK